MVCHSLFQGIFPTQGSNPSLLPCRRILYYLSYQGNPMVPAPKSPNLQGGHVLKLGSVQFSSVSQLCLTLCDPVDCTPPGSSVHGILQARIPEWVAMPSSRGSSPPRNQTHNSCIAGRFFTPEKLRKPMIKMHDFKTGSQRSSYPSPDPEISSALTHTTNQKKCSKCFCFFFCCCCLL